MSDSSTPSATSKAKIQKVLRVALILSIATAIEFVIAFVMQAGATKTAIFVVLTIVKAFYIVGEFMHLSHERKSLIWSVLFPMIFVALLIFILIYESGHVVYAP